MGGGVYYVSADLNRTRSITAMRAAYISEHESCWSQLDMEAAGLLGTVERLEFDSTADCARLWLAAKQHLVRQVVDAHVGGGLRRWLEPG